MKSFKDDMLNITYFYPSRFVPDPASVRNSSDSTPKCVRSTLSANAVTPADTTSFVLSTIDGTCAAVLHGASTQTAAFLREQIIRQLKQYGTPTITQDPTHYLINGHPASIVLASVPIAATPGHLASTLYAAKACFLGNIPEKGKKKGQPVEATHHVLCFDFTTQHQDLYHLLFTFSVQFDNDAPQPLVPGTVMR